MSVAEDRSFVALGRCLYEKWRRDSAETVSTKSTKAASYLFDLARARLYLREADEVAADVRVMGRPLVRNEGRLTIGPRAVLRSIVAPIEITVGPGASMSVGRSTHLNSGGTFAAACRIELGERVEVAPYVAIYDTSFHAIYERNRAPEPREVVVEDDVWLGAKCTVLPGVRIGRGAVVMANSLVTRNVEPFTIVAGVPAEPVARLDPTRFVVDPTA